jgi:hypothetical protein
MSGSAEPEVRIKTVEKVEEPAKEVKKIRKRRKGARARHSITYNQSRYISNVGKTISPSMSFSKAAMSVLQELVDDLAERFFVVGKGLVKRSKRQKFTSHDAQSAAHLLFTKKLAPFVVTEIKRTHTLYGEALMKKKE